MTQPSSKAKWPSGAQSFFFASALLTGLVAAGLLYDAPGSYAGWTVAFFALLSARLALPGSPESRKVFNVSTRKVLGIVAIGVLPPLLIMLVFGHRPGWTIPLVILFLACASIGPFVLLRRSDRRSAYAPPKQGASSDAARRTPH